jgi:hypothetical protein
LRTTTSLSARLQGPLKALLGDDNVVFPPATGSEDAHLLRGDNPNSRRQSERKGWLFTVGIADPAVFLNEW